MEIIKQYFKINNILEIKKIIINIMHILNSSINHSNSNNSNINFRCLEWIINFKMKIIIKNIFLKTKIFNKIK